jgi:hypothetical protein
MISVIRKKYFLNIQDVYFAKDSEKVVIEKETDIVIFVQTPDRLVDAKEFHTQIIDLTKAEDEIFKEIHENDRNKINKGIKNNWFTVKINNIPSLEDIKDFEEFFKIFAEKKGIKDCSIGRINSLIRSKALIITTVQDCGGEILCYHLYAVDGERARLLYSTSKYIFGNDPKYRNHIGIANRYLHWCEIKYFKSNGFSIYDFGGISMEKDDPHMMNINRFKQSFGGKEIIEYNKYKGISFLGRILVWILRKNV